MAKRYLVHEDLSQPVGGKDRYIAGVLIDGDSLEVWGIFKTYLMRNGQLNAGYAKLFVDSREAEWSLKELSQIMSYQDAPDKTKAMLVEFEAESEDLDQIRKAVSKDERVVLKNPYGINN